jgi:hypothetical protein
MASDVSAAGTPVSTVGGRYDAPLESDEPDTDPLAWLDAVDQRPSDTPEKAALGSWLGAAGLAPETKLAPEVAAGADAPTAMLPAETGPATSGSFFPAKRRGIGGWSSKIRWSVAVSIVLLIGVVVASVVIAQTISANNVAARELAAAVADLEAAEETATQPQSVLDAAVKKYDETVESARVTADSAGPPLAAIAGMAAQPLLDASNATLAALVAELDASTVDDPPEPYQRGDVDVTDIEEVRAATTIADDHAELVATATREVAAAQAALQEKLDALRAAQVVLGGSLPETAVVIVGENQDALQSFRDAVIAASVAVPAAQNAGGSGDAELLAYAAAVTALRGDQARAIAEEDVVVTPPRTTVPAPEPEPEPVPPPPVPEPTPEPTIPAPEPTDPPPPPPPTEEPVP